jgi:hypothetical protein
LSVVFAACSCAALAQTVSKTTTITQTYTFPPVAVASTETLQVNLANTASAVFIAGPITAPATSSCTGTVTVTNAAGAVIGKANPFTVAGNAIQSIAVPYGSIGATGAARAVVLVSVQRTITVPATTVCNLVYSLETFLTTTGETHLLLGNASAAGVVPLLTGVISPTPPTSPGGGN